MKKFKINLDQVIKSEGLPLFIYADGTISGQLIPGAEQVGVVYKNVNCALSNTPESQIINVVACTEFLPMVKVGWYAFADGNFSPNPDAYEQLQGVVGWLNPDKDAPSGQRGLIVLAEVESLPWANARCVTRVWGDDGKYNTRLLLEYGKRNNIAFPAAEWCASYSQNGIKAGEAFLPSKLQLLQLSANLDIICSALAELGIDLGVYATCWSSTEVPPSDENGKYTSTNTALVVRLWRGVEFIGGVLGRMGYMQKSDANMVLACLAF